MVAAQIAAGEVVERPASVVKELVENAIDAGATRIEIDLEQGGVELVRISDDGSGILRDDLPLAVAPHATSKIRATSDLDHIATLGFRGEALASIASVSRLSIRSRTPDAGEAWQLDLEGDPEAATPGRVRPAAGAPGTVVSVRNLFFNTPARRKFLRTTATEQSRCVDAVTQLALSHPAVAFVCRCDGRVVIDVPREQTPHRRALDLLGPELQDQLLEISADRYDDARGLTLWGLVGLPAIARATRAAQHLFINGRAVRDRTVQHALQEGYRGILEPGRFPTALLMIEMSPEGVDVNVHPQKAEVRFRDSGVVHSVVYHAVKRALAAADLTPTLTDLGRPSRASDPRAILPGPATPEPGGSRVSPPIDGGGPTRAAFVDYFRRFMPSGPTERLSYDAIREAVRGTGGPGEGPSIEPATPVSTDERPAREPGLAPAPRPADRVLQVHNSYLVTQDAEGVVIVDQHALHERVMFEALLARVLERDLESQRLLTPVVVDVTPAQSASIDELSPLFKRIGIEASALGPRQVGVSAFPSFLFERGVDAGGFVRALLDRAGASDFAPGSEDALRDVLDMMACKAAVKAGDRMSEGELTELLRLREAVERSSNCPHGRPTTVRLTIRELERLFGRA